MVVKIRRGVFETNSSSTHSLTMCSRKDYDAWKRGDMVYDDYEEELVSIDSLTEEELELVDEDRYYTHEGYYDHCACDYDSFDQTFVSEKGEEIVAFGYYGYS